MSILKKIIKLKNKATEIWKQSIIDVENENKQKLVDKKLAEEKVNENEKNK